MLRWHCSLQVKKGLIAAKSKLQSQQLQHWHPVCPPSAARMDSSLNHGRPRPAGSGPGSPIPDILQPAELPLGADEQPSGQPPGIASRWHPTASAHHAGAIDEWDGMCVVCMDAPSSVEFLPCGHQVTCKQCAMKIAAKNNEYPICRCRVLQAGLLPDRHGL